MKSVKILSKWLLFVKVIRPYLAGHGINLIICLFHILANSWKSTLLESDKDEASQAAEILKAHTLQAKDKHQEEELHQTSKS
jgi:hypothetical protein